MNLFSFAFRYAKKVGITEILVDYLFNPLLNPLFSQHLEWRNGK